MGPERHPRALGQRRRECWEEIWDIIGPQIDHVMTGQGATWHEDHLVRGRHGEKEDVWWTYSFSPIDDDTTREGLVESLYLQRCHRTASNMDALRSNEERLQLALEAGVVGLGTGISREIVFLPMSVSRACTAQMWKKLRGARPLAASSKMYTPTTASA